MGIFNSIFLKLSKTADNDVKVMIDATHLKAHRTAASVLKKVLFPRCIGRARGELNIKLHALCNGEGRSLAFTLAEGQVSDYKGAKKLLAPMPQAQELLADQVYDADLFREELFSRGIITCIPPKINQKNPTKYNKTLYKERDKIEIMFGRLKD